MIMILIFLLVFVLIPIGLFIYVAFNYNNMGDHRVIKLIALFLLMCMVLFIMFIGLLRGFVILPYQVSGNSMSPTLEDGDYMLANKLDKNYRRNQIITFRAEHDYTIVSRIIALPGENVQIADGVVFVNGVELDSQETPGAVDIILGAGEYFVLSDNRANSIGDSRDYGPIKARNIRGTYLTDFGK